MKNTIKMKSILRIAGIIAIIAVIGFSMGACNNGSGGGGGGGGSTSTTSGSSGNGSVPTTSGQLTITGISSQHNGKWVCGFGTIGNTENPLVAFDSFSTSGKANLAKISNGSATLKVWRESGSTLVGYSGSDTNYFQLVICTKSQMDESIAGMDMMDLMSMMVEFSVDNIKFSGGKASYKWVGLPGLGF